MKTTTNVSDFLITKSLFTDPWLHIIDANRSEDHLRTLSDVNNFVAFDWLQADSYDVN